MALIELTRAEHEDFRQAAEARVSRVLDREIRLWLADITAALREGLSEGMSADTLIAAGAELPLNLGTMTRWWADRVNEAVVAEVREVWEQAYVRTRPGELLGSSLDRLDTFLAMVSDRLVRGLQPPLPDDAMDRTRVVIAQSAALGWSTGRTSQALAAALSWEQSGPALRREYERLTQDIEAILDPLGPPGTPAREAAREGDPRVGALQDMRAAIVRELDNEQSHWQVRANRIARTESTAAYNFANLTALADEGWTHKEWLATRDTRTREAHVDLDGQVVRITEPFIVDGLPIFMPGDPSAAAHLTINCRCILVGADAPEGEEEPEPEAPEPSSEPTADDYVTRQVNPLAVERAAWLPEPRAAAQAVQIVNPLYSTEPLATVNCQKTTTAFELQRRGFDAYASLGEGGEMWLGGNTSRGNAFNTWWIGPDTPFRLIESKKRGANKHDDISAQIEERFPVGARGSIVVDWTNSRSSHIFNWERTASGVQFWDAQPGRRYERDDGVWSRMKQKVYFNRLDDAIFLPKGERALEDREALEAAVARTAGYGALREKRADLVIDKVSIGKEVERLRAQANDPSLSFEQRDSALTALSDALDRLETVLNRLSDVLAEIAQMQASNTINAR